jgi:transposase
LATRLLREFVGFEKRVRQAARSDERVRLLMSIPGVGAIVGLTYASAIDDTGRFESSKMVGAHFGLTPKKYQSGETDYSKRRSQATDLSTGAVACAQASNLSRRFWECPSTMRVMTSAR